MRIRPGRTQIGALAARCAVVAAIVASLSACDRKPAPAPPAQSHQQQSPAPPAGDDQPRVRSTDAIKPGGLPAPTPTPPAAGTTAAPPPVTPPPSVPASSPDGKTAIFLGLTGPKPAAWQDRPPTRTTRTAEYVVPGMAGESASDAAHVLVFYFGSGSGGTPEANIERWKGQFRNETGEPVEATVSKFEADGMPITLAELHGHYQAMGAPDFKAGQTLMSAIVQAPIGTVFIQLVGDSRTVAANREAFLELLRGLRKADASK